MKIGDIMDTRIDQVGKSSIAQTLGSFKAYVNGFMINPETQQILLIEKNRPEFQKGKWNGIGGKIEPGEASIDAMVREFKEEADVTTSPTDWEHTLTLRDSHFSVDFYRAFVTEFPPFRALTDEPLGVYYLKSFFDGLPALDNARWIVPLQFAIGVKFPLDIQWIGRRDSHV